MSEDYWDGALWIYQADITNDASDAANHTYTIVPGTGNEMEILYGNIFNGDTVARNTGVRLMDGANTLGWLTQFGSSTGAGIYRMFPAVNISDNFPITGGKSRLFMAGTMELEAIVTAVAISQDSAFAVVCRIRGGVPTVTETASAGVPVISINTEQVF